MVIDFNAGKTQLVSFDWCNNSGAIDLKMDGSLFGEKLSVNKSGQISFLARDYSGKQKMGGQNQS